MAVPPNSLYLGIAALGVAVVAALLWRMSGAGRDRKIRVVGVGGGGANAVEAMMRARLRGVDYIVVNSDVRALRRSSASTKLAIGRHITNGLGTGGDAGAGEVAARDATDQIGRAVAGSDFVVITAGLGGGVGSGAAPVVAEIARQKGALTMAIVTTPFGFEGSRRQQLAQTAAAALASKVDAVATIPNDRMREGMPPDATMEDAFHAVDETLSRTLGEILELVSARGRMNLDFSDVRTVLQGGGSAAVGIGRAAGENRAVEATRNAMAAALAGTSIAGATSVLVNVSGSNKLRLAEVESVAETVLAAAGGETNIVFGMSQRPRLGAELQVTLIATGVGKTTSAEAQALSTAGEAVPPWRPVWLRRAQSGDQSQPLARNRRKGVSPTGVDAAPASEGTGADSA
jgi:cell division protein FtsZ